MATSQDVDPLAWAVDHAPEDDEPVSPADEKAIAEGEADYAAGRIIPLEQIRHEREADSL